MNAHCSNQHTYRTKPLRHVYVAPKINYNSAYIRDSHESCTKHKVFEVVQFSGVIEIFPKQKNEI